MGASAFESMLDKRMIFVTGKGGVGKTTIATALALRASELGLRTLLMGIDSTAQIEHLFGIPPLQDLEIKQVAPNLKALNLDRQLLLNDFIKSTLRLSPLYNRVLNSPLYQYFTAIAPGFRELMTLARIGDLEEEMQKGKKLPMYDLLVVDAPATGHGMSLLDVPRSVSTMFSVGPFAIRARKLDAFFKDPSKTSVLMVTLAEEMPANEAQEMYVKLREDLKIHVSGVVINNLYPPLFPDQAERAELAEMLGEPGIAERLAAVLSTPEEKAAVPVLLESAAFQQSRRAVNERFAIQIKERIPIPNLELEFMPTAHDDMPFLRQVALSFGF